MRSFIFMIVVLLMVGCGKGSNNTARGDLVGPEIKDIEELSADSVSLLNFEVELYSYIPKSDSKVKYRASFQNIGEKVLEGAYLSFKGDTCLYSFKSWTEIEMLRVDNIDLAAGEIYYSAFYNGHDSFPDLWAYYIHNNCGSWTGLHYVKVEIINSSGEVLASNVRFYSEALTR